MNTKKMELSMDELEMVNGGELDPDKKIEVITTMTASGAALGAVAGAGIGSIVPVVGTLVGGAVGTVVGAAVFGGTAAIGYWILDD